MQCNPWNIRNNLFLSRNQYTVGVSLLTHCMNSFVIALRPLLLSKYTNFFYLTKFILSIEDDIVIILEKIPILKLSMTFSRFW